MQLVDAHCHVSLRWFEPVETLLYQMDRLGVARAVLIQILGQYDNTYQEECIRAHPDRLISVVAVDPATDSPGRAVARLIEGGASGFRLPADGGGGEQECELWESVVAAGFPVSCVGSAAQFASPAFANKLSTAATVPVVLEHLGGIGRSDFVSTGVSLETIFELSKHPQVYLKAPGLGQLGKRRALSLQPPIAGEAGDLLREAVRRFGAVRIMWGSDFPPVATREGYANALEWPRQECAQFSDADRAAIFGGCAAHVFRTARA